MMIRKSFFFYIFLLFVPIVQSASSDFKELQALRETLKAYSYSDGFFDSCMETVGTSLQGFGFGGLNGAAQIAFFPAIRDNVPASLFILFLSAIMGGQQGWVQGLAARTGSSPQLSRERLFMYMAIHEVLVFAVGVFAGTIAEKQDSKFHPPLVGVIAGNIVGFILLLPEILLIKSDRKALAKEVENLKNAIQDAASRYRRLDVA